MTSDFTLRTGIYPEIDPSALAGSLHGKNALITGSGRGIGREMALALAKAGARIGVTARSADQVAATVDEINDLSDDTSRAVGIVADLLSRPDQTRLVDEFHQKLGPIDILICNAGSNRFVPFHLSDADSWWDLIELNLRAPVELTRLLVPEMRQRNKGTIIYTSSIAAQLDLPWTTAYNCGKTAITRFAGTLQAEMDLTQKVENGVDNKIKVFSIHPGEIKTSLHEVAFPEKTKAEAPYVLEKMKELAKRHPTFAPELPAWTCVWLCSGNGSALKGRFVDCTRDVGEQAKSAGTRT